MALSSGEEADGLAGWVAGEPNAWDLREAQACPSLKKAFAMVYRFLRAAQ